MKNPPFSKQKLEKQKELNVVFYNQVLALCDLTMDIYIREINRTQIRVTDNYKTIDLYPKSEKFCRIPQNEWGLVGNDLEGFLKKEFA
jgi:hypothetical protein